FEARAVRTVADEAERRVDTPCAQPLESVEDVVRPLHRRHAADPADREPIRRDAEVAARLLAPVRLRAAALVELHPETDDREPLGRRDAERAEAGAHLRAPRDERCRVSREPALEQQEEP